MVGAMFLPAMWAAVIAAATLLACVGAEGEIGVNWGTIASHPLEASVVVKMLKDNGIKKVKLFDLDSVAHLSALSGTGIETIVGVPNYRLQKFATNYDYVKDWVKQNISAYLHEGGVDIKYIAVGNEPFLAAYKGDYVNITFPAMQNVQKALDAAGHGDKVKVTTPLNGDVYQSFSNLPSDGKFRADIYDSMKQIVKFLDEHKSPFMVNIYPFINLYQNPGFPFNYAFLDNDGKVKDSVVDDKGTIYYNVLDAHYDTLTWSLKDMGVNDMKIIIGEVGWPTDGNIYANVTLAKRFYNGLFKRVASNKGTPMRPNEKYEIYLFSFLDEDVKSVDPGNFERHWGIFRYDGTPKFAMDFSGEGVEKMPVAAKGVEYMERKWCVVADNVTDLGGDIQKDVSWACEHSDCTSLGARTRRRVVSEVQRRL
ncbi:glucan endo-1,3-beta-glucosidase 5-like isoform X2 [Momordica charantia]|uniref:glucan endo-1,3-beta-D-glucosidase n=1 Tax=Momordica charantia TaxID=3673 RepID=A0A6J1BTC0_MOMCH|nr:glucan endo-1,3-beta-glucosidase 5-like isoform X2 [Momordica charantia]